MKIEKSDTKNKIIRSAAKLFLQKSIFQIRMEEIAKRANISKGTIYIYFKNKEEIIFTVFDIMFQDYQKEYSLHINERMSSKEKLLNFFNFSQHNNEYLIPIYQCFIGSLLIERSEIYNIYFEKFYQSIYIIVSEHLKEGIKQGEFVPIVNIDILTDSIIIQIQNIFIKAKITNMQTHTIQNLLTSKILALLNSCTL